MKRLPLVLAGAAILIKLAAVVLIRTSSDAAAPLLWLALADPVPVWAAEVTTGLVFDQRRLSPTGAEALAFDGILVLVSGLQGYFCGVVIQWLWRWRTRDGKTAAVT
jgi:hypothetical protein